MDELTVAFSIGFNPTGTKYCLFGDKTKVGARVKVTYMCKTIRVTSAPASRNVIQQEEVSGYQETCQWVDPTQYEPCGKQSQEALMALWKAAFPEEEHHGLITEQELRSVHFLTARVDIANCKIWLKEVWVKSRLMLRLCHSIDFVQVYTMSRTFRCVYLPLTETVDSYEPITKETTSSGKYMTAELLDVIQNVPIDASIERVILAK
ncbi:hypothetical protein Tco_1074382 [Tanacetum coccineum]